MFMALMASSIVGSPEPGRYPSSVTRNIGATHSPETADKLKKWFKKIF